MKWTSYVLMAATLVSVAASNAQSQRVDTAALSAATRAKLIKSALSAAPANIAANATVAVPGADGQMTVLRQGANGFTCIPDAPASSGVDPMCIDEEGMKWAHAWMSHEAKPGNTAPGLIYMLAGGSDISATDPWATRTDHFIASPPHWMILWPFDAATSGLPTKPKKTGTWIMWAGTPYAHLMVNQVP
jgi:hypothetical protein